MRVIKQFKTDQGRVFASTFTENAQGVLMNVWSGNLGGAKEIDRVIQYSAELLRSNNLEFWLSDVSNLEGAVEQDSLSAIEQFNRILRQTNLKKFSKIEEDLKKYLVQSCR